MLCNVRVSRNTKYDPKPYAVNTVVSRIPVRYTPPLLHVAIGDLIVQSSVCVVT